MVAWLIYVVLTVAAPAAEATGRYGLSLAQLNLLRATFLVPYLFIWLTALMTVVRFQHYAHQVSGSPEGAGFKKLAQGLGLLFLTLILPAFLNLFSTYFPDSLEVQKLTTIVTNYVTVILYLWAFWQLFRASQELNTAATTPAPKRLKPAVIGTVAVLVLLYSWAVFHNDFRTVSVDPLVRPTYFLPDWLIIFTVMIPYIVVWLWGSLTIANIRHFARHVPGVVYRPAFLSVARGLTGIIGLLIVLQFLSQGAALFSQAKLSTILAVIYLLLIIIAVPYLFLARGGRQLSAIEDV
jgi:hypothetical protein